MDAHKELSALEIKLIVPLPGSTSSDLLSLENTTNIPTPTLALKSQS